MEDLLKKLEINPAVVAVQAVVFFTLFLIMSRLFFGRLLEHLRRREEETREALDRIAERQKEVEALKAEYEKKLKQIEQEAQARLQAAVQEGIRIRNEMAAMAEEERRRELDQARKQISRERERAVTRLRRETSRLAGEIAERVLAEPVPPEAIQKAMEGYFREGGT